jgi:hypothetical protein
MYDLLLIFAWIFKIIIERKLPYFFRLVEVIIPIGVYLSFILFGLFDRIEFVILFFIFGCRLILPDFQKLANELFLFIFVQERKKKIDFEKICVFIL